MERSRRRAPDRTGRVLASAVWTCLAIGGGSAAAAVFNVDVTDDAVDLVPGDGVCQALVPSVGTACTLRAAVQEAFALAGPDRVIVPASTFVLKIDGADEDLGATGDLDVDGGLEIAGAGAEQTLLATDVVDRLLDVHGGDLTLTDLSLRGGTASDSSGQGGCVRHFGSSLLMQRVSVDDCEAEQGGGIFAGTGSGEVILEDTTVYNCRALGPGSGGGGLSALSLTATNSTISSNVATVTGGGVVAAIDADLLAVTIADNAAAFGGGLAVLTATETSRISHVIVANNTGGDCAFPIDLEIDSYNLDGDATCGFLDATDLPGTDPALKPLGRYGGPTLTHEPRAWSPAVNTGDCVVLDLSFDQRGTERPQGNACDIGAVEFRPRSSACGLGAELSFGLLLAAARRHRGIAR